MLPALAQKQQRTAILYDIVMYVSLILLCVSSSVEYSTNSEQRYFIRPLILCVLPPAETVQ